MKITTTTTYIGKDGEIKDVKRKVHVSYFQVALPFVRQTAVIKDYEEGMKITVTRLEPDN